MKHGKKYVDSAKLVDRSKLYDVNEALDLCVKTGTAKFDETVEIHVKLGVDSRHADQQVRGAIGAEEMIQKIQTENWMDFDILITTPDMMGLVGRLGKILGPRGLMPNPKAGTVTREIGKAVAEAKAGKIEYRLDKTNIIHCTIGKVSFGTEKLQQNFDALLGAIIKAKPAASKGQYVRSCVVACTMGPGVRINPTRVGG